MNLREQTAKGLFWVGLDNILVGGLRFCSQIVLARILLPRDFGIVSIGLLVINTLNLFSGFGIESALIQRQDNIKESASTGFIILPMIGLVLFLMTFFLAPLVASFYRQEALLRIIRLFSLTFLLNSFSIIPAALLTREMEFRKKIVPDVGAVLAYAATAVFLALKFRSVYSIVYGYIAGILANLILVWVVSPWRPVFKFKRDLARQMISYGRFILGTAIISFALTQGDNALVGKVLNLTVLGFYALAYTISNLVATDIALVISRVMFPVFCRLQDESKKLEQGYLITLNFTLLVVAPVAAGMIVLGNTLIKPLLGAKWLPCVLALQVLCLHGLFRSVHIISCFLIDAFGKPKINQDILLFQLLGLALIIYPLTVKFGIVGTAIAVTLMRLLACLVTLQGCIKILNISWKTVFNSIWLPVAGSMVMFAIIFFSKEFIFSGDSLLQLAILVLIGAVTYIVFVFGGSHQTRIRVKEIFYSLSLDAEGTA